MRAVRVRSAILTDARLQWRQGFYGAYLLLTALYVLILRALPDAAARVLAPLIVFSDPAVIGFFFIGGIVLLERTDRTLDALFITPLRPAEYLAAKLCSLGAIVIATSLAIALGAVGMRLRPAPLLLGVGLTATLCILVGVALVSRFGTLNRFAFGGGLSISLLALPVLPWLGWVGWGPLALLPTGASIYLIGGAFAAEAPSPSLSAAAALWLLAWNAAAWVWARRWFDRYVIGATRGVGATP